MTTGDTHATPCALRPAEPGDVDAIASVWYAGWRESHLGQVPDALVAHRSLDQFRERVPVMLATTTVATVNGQVAGVVVTHDDEIEQLYVAHEHRGSGVAAALLDHGETVISATFPRAFLAVVAGNARARRFYERQGWDDVGPFDYLAWTPDGDRVPVPSHRYEKELRPAPWDTSPTQGAAVVSVIISVVSVIISVVSVIISVVSVIISVVSVIASVVGGWVAGVSLLSSSPQAARTRPPVRSTAARTRRGLFISVALRRDASASDGGREHSRVVRLTSPPR